MARGSRRVALVEAATDHVLREGLVGLSLRPLAASGHVAGVIRFRILLRKPEK